MSAPAASRGTRAAPALPGVLEEIAEVAGHDAALTLALTWGGEEVHVPKPGHLERCPDHPLASILADLSGAARAIAERFGGSRIYIPQARAACARHLAGEGIPAGAIAARLRLSHRSVRRLIRDS